MKTDAATPLRRFKRYPAYKDSGVEWLGEIPAHWEVATLKRRATRIQTGTTPPTGETHYYEDGVVPWYGPGSFGQDLPLQEPVKFIADSAVRDGVARVFEAQSAVIITIGATIGKVAFMEHPGSCNQQITGVTFNLRQLFPRYGAYQLKRLEPVLRGIAPNTTLPIIDQEEVGYLPFAVPPVPEQEAITAFLDRETARIDALVAKKERLIELLQEKRTALITRAVTKGLDPNVPMKDSGVEWLGEIPAHWEVERIKWAARMESGHTPDKKVESYWQGGNIPWVSLADTGQLREVDYIADTATRTTLDGIAHSSARVLPAGTVVFSRDATIGLCAITRAGMAVSQHFIGWVCGPRLQPEYLLFVLRSMIQELERLTMGATVRTIGMPDVRNLVTPIPPLREQVEIDYYVRKQRSQIDALVAKVRDAIDRLKELRTALISAAVTGKIDVRDEVRHSGVRRNPEGGRRMDPGFRRGDEGSRGDG